MTKFGFEGKKVETPCLINDWERVQTTKKIFQLYSWKLESKIAFELIDASSC